MLQNKLGSQQSKLRGGASKVPEDGRRAKNQQFKSKKRRRKQ